MNRAYEEKIIWVDGTPFGYNVREISFNAPEEHTDMFEILMCLKGEIKISYCFEEFLIKKGEFILIDRDAHFLYDGISEDGGGAICASIYCDYNKMGSRYSSMKNRMFVCEGISTLLDKNERYVPYHGEDHTRLKSLILAVLLYLSQSEGEEKRKEKVNSAADKIVDIIDKRFDIMFYYDPDIEISNTIFSRVNKLTGYIICNYKEDISLDSLSRETGLSKVYISSLMKKYSIGFNGLLAYVRAAEATSLLRKTDLTITEISEICNFSDTKYMYSAFREWFHSTPSQYRKKYREEMGQVSREEYIEIKNVHNIILDVLRDHFISTVI